MILATGVTCENTAVTHEHNLGSSHEKLVPVIFKTKHTKEIWKSLLKGLFIKGEDLHFSVTCHSESGTLGHPKDISQKSYIALCLFSVIDYFTSLCFIFFLRGSLWLIRSPFISLREFAVKLVWTLHLYNFNGYTRSQWPLKINTLFALRTESAPTIFSDLTVISNIAHISRVFYYWNVMPFCSPTPKKEELVYIKGIMGSWIFSRHE